MSERIHAFTVDYRRDGGRSARALVNRGFWIHGLPRFMPLCRILGHRPVVDGTEGYRERPGYRWVACDRCGVRTEPQGPIDTDLVVGQPYTDPLPGPWPASPRGVFGGQVVVGRGGSTLSVEAKVGNADSEHVLAGHIHLGHLGALYLHVENFGRGMQRRLNPRGYDSRVTGLAAHDGRLYWRVWAKRDSSSRDDPRWMDGSLQLDPRTILWGPKRYSYENVGAPVAGTIRMPQGDDHDVTLQLKRQSFGRARLRRRQLSWIVDCDAPAGLPTRSDGRGRYMGLSVPVAAAAVEANGWATEAGGAIVATIARDRARNGYRAPMPT